ncbi:acyltransferase ChoActase/COT/CPT [Syncephalis pseudoplumigaleata]|uniref:Acyltransferase ChoActase/COT/CPT n=1 Tax=Syncephalis pseudoplumigaleata TaxID=1712513 RepID=A0A4P9YUI5_9FUNG|nr:acyltransferase ChoActase/COT/CPT [Syncephalis pseudoplumigaleata]|eukprot:RKP23693.1 acyltransferase ChoActase/COT/CPT [Syncephalis pseudoplumigaleata]
MTVVDFTQHQLQLPRLPLPRLETTFDEYLRMLEPLLTAEQFAAIKQHVADFLKPSGFGERLQRRLRDAVVHSQQSQGSWLYQLATNYEFLQCRHALLVKTNTFTLFADDPTLERVDLVTDSEHRSRQGVYSAAQIKRAARLINGFLDVKDAMAAGRYPESQPGTGRLCLHQYRYLFGVTRTPMLKCDVLRGSGSGGDGGEHAYTDPVRHITVLVDNQPYSVPVYAEDGGRVTDADLERQLWAVVEDVESRTKHEEPVCIWTGMPRDHWAARERLIDVSERNITSLHAIEDSLFVVALDRFSGRRASQQEGKGIAGLDESHRNGFSCSENRWFDKSFSLIVESDGRAGIQCEHAACDGLVPSKVAAEALKHPVQFLGTASALSSDTRLPPPEALHFELDERLHAMLLQARQETATISANSDSCCLQFTDYGSDFIKHTGSPDAYIEMAFQLAFYRIHGEFASACESIGMRGFLKGRTEIGRVFSMECRAWCMAMQDPATTIRERYRLLQEACRVHKDMIARALRGEGASWHLHALYLMQRKDEAHPVFTSAMAKEGSRWRIYAGSLNSADTFYCGGFAASAPDGYGIGYHFRRNAIHIGIECDRQGGTTSSAGYRGMLLDVLREMASMCRALDSTASKEDASQ